MRLKIGDNVKVISGSDKGQFGKITMVSKGSTDKVGGNTFRKSGINGTMLSSAL